ncbi:MAG: hypothetical protein ACI9NC_002730, partial [Verrucomicrobiales bacterium]
QEVRLTVSENTHQKHVFSYLRSVWGRGQKQHAAAGALVFFCWLIPLFFVGMAIDWLTRMPTPGRIVILALALGVALYKAWRRGWRHLRAFNAARTALRVENHHGGLDSLVVSAVQFQEAAPTDGTSAAMRELTLSKAEQAIMPLPAEEVVSYHRLRPPLALAITLTLLVGVFAILKGPFLAAGIARIFPPWLAVDYPTRTQLEVENGDMVVKEGSPALIRANVSGVIPKGAKVALRTGTGKPRMHELEITDGVCEYPIDSAFRGFEYRITAGDARSQWHSVEVIASPRIERAQVSLEFPAYTERASQVVEALTVTVPEETQIQWQLTLDRALSEALFTPAGGDPQPLEISADGRTVTMAEVAKESRAYSFSWVEKEHGFSFISPNHYLQVAPDQSPRVEITSPKNNLYATLGRQIDLALRARDDHGIGESLVAYRVNKIEEVKVPFPAAKLGEGTEQPIDWDYRTALPELAIGDAVSFVVEVADSYPGAEGAHRARSQARRVTFLSKEDYLAQIARQRLRLLSQLRNIYREERAVHATISKLDPSADVFVQTCQLEAVRQDMMQERLGLLKARMDDLLDDLAANHITDESETATLTRLSSDLQTIAQEHVSRAAASLRELAGASNKGTTDPAAALHMVDSAARELALMVLQVGFNEATEVMARELHSIAETQARLRLETILSEKKGLADAQDELAEWITRLFGGTPQDRESTIDDALVAFNLSRLIKELRSAGVVTKMAEAAALIRKPGSGEAVNLQADVIKTLLAAEFRLRIGSEREALVRAGELFQSQASKLENLRDESASLNADQFKQRKTEFAQAQTALQRKLHLLLMPAVPAPRARLFEVDLPPTPPIDDLLAAAEDAMEESLTHISAGDRDMAAIQQEQAVVLFDALSEIVSDRIERLTERNRVNSLVGACGKHATEIGQFIERQLVLLEMAEDAEGDSTELVRVAQLEQKLADELERFRAGIVESQVTASDELLPLLSKLEQSLRAMTSAVVSLKDNQVDTALAHQETALEALEDANLLLEKQTAELTALMSTLQAAWLALMPAPYVADIQAEQRDLVEAVPNTKEAGLPRLAIVQKNLIHAVNAVLESLDPLSHQIESGTVFLFAKEDMDAAAIALETNDLAEAEDAGSFVAETLGDLLVELEQVTPQYSYVLELTEFFHEMVSEGMIIRATQGQLRGKAIAAADEAALRGLVDEQRALETRAKNFGSLLEKATGQKGLNETTQIMAEALRQLETGDRDAAVEQMEIVEENLGADSEELVELMTHFAVLLQPLLVQPEPEILFTLEVLALASQQRVLYRETQIAPPEQVTDLVSKQRELATKCEVSVPRSESHPKLVAASEGMLSAASNLESSAPDKAVTNQRLAGDALRHFVIEYVQQYVIPPGPPPPSDPVPSDPTESLGDDFSLFMPGAVSGGKPKGGRQEWEVLGRRDRAALNENFARELPLEYRAILKDYYERLAE